jgi:hypothetical protein
MRQLGVPINLDIERHLIFNLNVMDKCIEKYGKMDDILSISDLKEVRWLAVEMLNEDAEIWNDEHDEKKPLMDEKRLNRYVDGIGGLSELQQKVNAAILKGLPKEAVQEVEEVAKNLIAAQSQMKKMNSTGTTLDPEMNQK